MLADDEINRVVTDFFPRLVALANQNISTRWQSKFDAEDVAATVCRTFVRRYREASPVPLDDEVALWRLFVVITLNKVRNKTRDLSAQKRGGGRAVASQEVIDQFTGSRDPLPEEAAEYLDLLSMLQTRLDSQAVEILQLKLQGEEGVAIAQKLGISTRTVTRRLQSIQKALEDLLAVETGSQLSN